MNRANARDDPLAIRTQAEVAAIMTAKGFPMNQRDVWYSEQQALRKLRPLLEDMAVEFGLLTGNDHGAATK